LDIGSSRPLRGVRSLTDDQVYQARLALVRDPQLRVKALAELLEIPLDTARKLRNDLLKDPALQEIQSESLLPTDVLGIVSELEKAAGLGVRVLVDQLERLNLEHQPQMKPSALRDLARVVSETVEKAQLLQGKPTEIHELMARDPSMFDELIEAQMVEVKRLEGDGEIE